MDTDKRNELREDFEHFDSNHDGLMHAEEFMQFMSGLDAGMSTTDYRLGFQEIDVDHDGVIQFEEFLDWWESP